MGSRQLIAADEPAADAAASDAPAAGDAASDAATATPVEVDVVEVVEVMPADVEVPPYYTGNSPDPNKPTWPDATGAASGAWATPAADKTGDIPSKLSISEVYDRVVHNMFSINVCWTLITGAMVMFMQAGFSMVEGGLSRQKNANLLGTGFPFCFV